MRTTKNSPLYDETERIVRLAGTVKVNFPSPAKRNAFYTGFYYRARKYGWIMHTPSQFSVVVRSKEINAHLLRAE